MFYERALYDMLISGKMLGRSNQGQNAAWSWGVDDCHLEEKGKEENRKDAVGPSART